MLDKIDYKLFRITVKGSLSECLAEVNKRGLSVLALKIHEYPFNSCSIDLESCDEYLRAWLHEDLGCTNFTVGSLLLYTSHREDTIPLTELNIV
jgi:hypothetical protein